MNRPIVFSTVTAVLAPEFIQKYSRTDLKLTLANVEEKLGVELITTNDTIYLIGKWPGVVEAHSILHNDLQNQVSSREICVDNAIHKETVCSDDAQKDTLPPRVLTVHEEKHENDMICSVKETDEEVDTESHKCTVDTNESVCNTFACSFENTSNKYSVSHKLSYSKSQDHMASNKSFYHNYAANNKEVEPEKVWLDSNNIEAHPDDINNEGNERNSLLETDAPQAVLEADTCNSIEEELKQVTQDLLQSTALNRGGSIHKIDPEISVAADSQVGELCCNKKQTKNETSPSFSCTSCDKCFCNITLLKTHMRLLHPRKAHGIVQKSFNCTLCSKCFDDKIMLEAHNTAFHAHSEVRKKSNQKAPKCVGEKFPCDKCKYVGKTKNYLRTHQIRYHADRYECDKCGKFFGFPAHLKAHKKTVHAAPQYLCKYCNTYYKTKTYYDQHVKHHEENKAESSVTIKTEITENWSSKEQSFDKMDTNFDDKNGMKAPIREKQSETHPIAKNGIDEQNSKLDKCTDGALMHENEYNSSYSEVVSHKNLYSRSHDELNHIRSNKQSFHSVADDNIGANQVNICLEPHDTGTQLQSINNKSNQGNPLSKTDSAKFEPETDMSKKIESQVAKIHLSQLNDLNTQDLITDKTREKSLGENMFSDLWGELKQKENESSESFKCTSCNESFRNITRLKSHMRLLHPAKRGRRKKTQPVGDKFPCGKCKYIGKTPQHLKSHQIKVHANRFKCGKCGKFYGYQNCLERHIKTVHAAPQYFCKECEKYYKTKKVYNLHVKLHKEKNPEIYVAVESEVTGSLSSKKPDSDKNNDKETTNKEIQLVMDPLTGDNNVNEQNIKQDDIEQNKCIGDASTCEDVYASNNYSQSSNDLVLHKHLYSRSHDKFDHISSNKEVFHSMADTCNQIVVNQNKLCSELRDVETQLQGITNETNQGIPLSETVTTNMVLETDMYTDMYKKVKSNKVAHEKEYTPQLNDLNSKDFDTAEIFSCASCEKIFSNITNLKKHMRLFHPAKRGRPQKAPGEVQKSFKCNLCGAHFDAKVTLNAHKKDFHASSKIGKSNNCCQNMTQCVSEQFLCGMCKYIGKTKQHLYAHQIRYHSDRFKCDECGKFFGFPRDLKRHKREVHTAPQYFCEDCDVYYKTKKSFDKHIKHHKETEGESSVIFNNKVIGYWSNKAQNVSKDDIYFEDKNGLKTHKTGSKEQNVNKHNTYLDDTFRLNAYNNNSIRATTEVHRSRKSCMYIKGTTFSCVECDYIGKGPIYLKLHYIRCHAKRYVCDECGKFFGYPKDLNRHKSTVHAAPQYFCKDCNMYYKTKFVYEQHCISHEENNVDGLFTCETCNKCFSLKTSLVSHIKKHIGIKDQYLCDICGKDFASRGSYQIHTRKVHAHVKVKEYKCSLCFCSFSMKKSYQTHMKIHTGVKQPPTIHSSSWNHTCHTCGKTFTTKPSLTRHERLHSNSQPFMCSLCNRTSTDASIIRRHVILVHKKDPKSWKEALVINTRAAQEDMFDDNLDTVSAHSA